MASSTNCTEMCTTLLKTLLEREREKIITYRLLPLRSYYPMTKGLSLDETYKHLVFMVGWIDERISRHFGWM